MTRAIKPETFAFLRELFESHLSDVLDDPSFMVHPDETRTPPEFIAELKAVCLDLGVDWDATLAAAEPFDRERLLAYERGETDMEPVMARVRSARLEQAREHFCGGMREWLTDPSTMVQPDATVEPKVHIGRMRARAKALGLDWDEVMALGTPVVQQRFSDIENGVLTPTRKPTNGSE